jgi:S-DNA-T family DNA segregation ATPase FtsK/SpoIIIE
MAEASEWADHRLIIFDRKHVEGRNWEHRARIVTELDEMDAVCDELIEEGEERLKAIPRGRDTVEISTSRPRITVFVDEGGELISDCKKDYATIIDRLRTVARKYRAAEIILVWATQKPSLTGDGHGIDSQIAGQMNNRLSLAVATAADSRVVFGEDASERGWTAHNLPMPGFAFFREQDLGAKSVPQMLRMRAMSAMQVIELPPRPIWSRQVSSTGATAQDIRERMAMDPWAGKDVGGEQTVSMRKPRVSAEDRDDQILSELSQDPCRSISSLATATGASKSVVKKRLGQMEADGLVWMDSDGCWHPVTD